MKIISKYKDYYDYLQGIFGIDNYKIYKRANIIKEKEFDLKFEDYKWDNKKPHFFYSFAINNKIYLMVKTKKGMFSVDEKILKELNFNKNELHYMLNLIGAETDVNKKCRKPIVVGQGVLRSYNYWKFKTCEWKKERDPYLKSFSFHKLLLPKDIYIEIDNFLGWLKDNPEISNKQTNAEKLLAKGFDKKISFRHRK